LKGVAQIWYGQWKGSRPVEPGPIEWEVFEKAFLDRFFPLELREAKMQEFINLKQGRLSVQEYSLNFTQLPKYAPSIVDNSRAEIKHFMMGVTELVENECRVAMIIDDMDILRLMVFAQRME